MARVFRPKYTAPIPAGAAIVVREGRRVAEYRRGGRLVRWPVRDVGGRTRMIVTVETWYCEFESGGGGTRRVKGFRDKRATEVLLLQLLRDDERRRSGLRGPDSAVGRRALGELAEEYLEVVAAKGAGRRAVLNVRRHLVSILPGCRWETWADVRPDSLLLFLGRLRDTRGLSPSTRNAYLGTAKAFARWVARRVQQPSPLDELAPVNVEADRRRSRRVLTPAELGALLAATAAGPRRGLVSGPDRAMLYRVAAYTGLRASELVSLTPESFALDDPVPLVRPEARHQKAKRPDAVPLPAHLAAALRPWLIGKPPRARLWPRQAARAVTLRRDCRLAGVALVDGKGRRATFHGLRRGYATALVRSAGADPRQLQRLARHANVGTTLAYYVDAELEDLGAVVDRLPAPPG